MNTSVKDFQQFYYSLMQSAPSDYIPWLFPVKENGKDPDALAIGIRAGKQSACCNADWLKVQRGQFTKNVCSKCGQGKGSWKAPWARLTKEEAIKRLCKGENVGIAARANDPLVIIDRDSIEAEAPKKETLTNKSRKRIGNHYFFYTTDSRCKILFATETLGEIRASDAYVVCAGSFCQMNPEEINKLPIEEQEKAGLYSCEKPIAPQMIVWEEMPKHFIEAFESAQKKIQFTNKEFIATRKGKQSALYTIRMSDLVANYSPRMPHPLHDSETCANFSLSDDGAVCSCWRHNRTLNAIHFLAVKSGHFDCSQVGKAHNGSNEISYPITDEMIFWAWHEAKKSGTLATDDPVPTRALKHLAIKHNICKEEEMSNKLPYWAYNKTIEILEREY